jgi:hypothetical protein
MSLNKPGPRLASSTLTAGLLAALSCLVFMACEQSTYSISVDNRTSQQVRVFEDNVEDLAGVPPGVKRHWLNDRFEGVHTLDVKSLVGKPLASRTFTWDEMKAEHGITLVVE